MRFDGIKLVGKGKYINRYDLEYTTSDNQKKIYEIISRSKELNTIEDLRNPHTDSVVIIVTDQNNEKILINREYRMAVGDFVYNFPAGLIDEGETPEIAAKRELKEETGLDLISIEDKLYDSYGAVGFSNEKNSVIIGTAAGTITESDSFMEEIEAKWYSKEEVRELLKSNCFAGRTQAYCYMWAK